MSGRNGNTRGPLNAGGGSGGRSMSGEAGQSIFDQHRLIRGLFLANQQQALEGPQPQSAHQVAGPPAGVREGMSGRNGNTRGRLIAVGGSGGRSMSVDAKRSEH